MPEPPVDPRPVPLTQLFASHPRHWRDNLYVYPVISRRSRGLSVGLNLNPDKACNFDCIYCQVDRTRHDRPPRAPSTRRLYNPGVLFGDLPMPEPPADPTPVPLTQLFASHPRHWRDNLYVYPVISRRSRGLSVGINLNPDKACNFDCIYCQVDRAVPPAVRKVDLDRLRAELDNMLDLALSGQLFADRAFTALPDSHRRLRDIAFSGDGEPTACPLFPESVDLAADLYRAHRLEDVKLRLITDAAYLARPRVRQAIARMHDCGGEVWAKLDAGTEPYYQLVNRPNVSLNSVLTNILDAARCFRVVIQSLWMNVHGQPPPPEEIDAFAGRLAGILAAGGRLLLVQVYTVVRQTAEPFVTPLAREQLDQIADRVRTRVNLPVEVFDS